MKKSRQTQKKETYTEQTTAIPDLSQYRIMVILPAYNEDRFIGSMVLKIKQYPVDVVVIDDGSSDETAEIARAAGATVFSSSQNQGKGAALSIGFEQARLHQPDALVIIDADGQHLPEELPQILKPILYGEADIAVGSRYLENTSNTPKSRRIGHKLINLATSIPSGIYISDSQNGFRAFSKKAYQAIHLSSKNFSVESEMQFIAQEHRLKITEVPVTIRYLDKVKRPAVKQGTIVLNGILRLIGQYRPLLFFGIPGTLFFLSSIVMGIIVVQRYAQTQELAIGYGMITVLMASLGLLLITTGITLHSIRAWLVELYESTIQERKNG